MKQSVREAVIENIRTYLVGKDVSQLPVNKAYGELYPDQIMPGDFEECFRAAMTPPVVEPAKEVEGQEGKTDGGEAPPV